MLINKFKYFFFVLILSQATLVSQNLDKYAVVSIDSLRYQTNQQFEFSINITRISDKWDRFANATIDIGFADSTFAIDTTTLQIAYIPNSTQIQNLQLGISGSDLPENSYYMTPRIVNGRISITISGPKDYQDCEFFDLNVPKRIGRFSLLSTSNRIPTQLKFLTPQFYYQALAYKTQDEIKINDVHWYSANDNVEMGVNYQIDDKQPKMVVERFWAEYAGDKKVTLLWITSSEPVHKGFLLRRLLFPFDELPIPPDTLPGERAKKLENKDFNFGVGKWDSGDLVDTLLIGNIMHMNGYNYTYNYDTVDYREETYCYELLYQDEKNQIIHLDTTCIEIPNVIIYSASAEPNPFEEQTIIKFKLLEDAVINCKAYDLTGKLYDDLLQDVKMSKGDQQLVFRPSYSASQGLYNIIILAKPVQDNPITIGRAILKVQFVRK